MNQILKFYKIMSKIGFTVDEFQIALKKTAKLGFSIPKKPSLKIYQKYARIYLDEYPEQKELRKPWLAIRWHYKSNWLYIKNNLEEDRKIMA